MHTAELTFTWQKRKADPEEVRWAIDELLFSLRRNGQLIEQDAPVVEIRGGWRWYVSLPDADSLHPKHRSKRVRDAIRALRKAGVEWRSTRVLGPDPESDPVCTCRKPPALILSTDFLSCETPLRCGGCGGVVPLYRIPPTSEYGNFEDLRFWAYHYRDLDSIWIASGAGERLAYRQLSEPHSELAEEGRDVCRLIEANTGVPTYYDLMRYYGRSRRAELQRRCPDCGGAWKLDEQWLDRYDFRCEKCRLVSNIASDLD
ncbi:MAG: DUF2310 family Zn-ribbon-containing protein [Phycisphaerae bacterium]|jgi:predicted  nucleic acid-binding Zn ribbon protein